MGADSLTDINKPFHFVRFDGLQLGAMQCADIQDLWNTVDAATLLYNIKSSQLMTGTDKEDRCDISHGTRPVR